MANLGLLGLVGGLGQGMSQTGDMLFREEIQKQREARLQAIRDKEYLRGRADSLSDYQRARTDSLDDYQRARADKLADYDLSRNDALADYERQLADKLSQFTTFETDKNGNLVGIDGNGRSQMIEGFEGSPYSVSDLTRVYSSTMDSLNLGRFGPAGSTQHTQNVQFLGLLQKALRSQMGFGLKGTYSPRQANLILKQMSAGDMTEKQAYDFLKDKPGFLPPKPE